jgi:hypothetical protein
MLPKTVIKRMDTTRKRFFWQGKTEKKSITWLSGQ